MTESLRILLVEDETEQRQLLTQLLAQQGYQVAAAESGEEALDLFAQQRPQLLLSDWKLPGISGIELIEQIRSQDQDIGIALMTAYGSIRHASKAIEAGADDYLTKPFQRDELLLCLHKVHKRSELKQQNKQLNAALSEQQQLVDIIGASPAMQRIYARIERVSKANVAVLIQGESGTGKELAARALHRLSERSGDFIAINCGAIPADLAEAELFGAKKGAYTGANQDRTGKILAADGGTLFLDEIAELPLELQAKLLRFLQEGTITALGSHNELKPDVRVVAATHQQLPEKVAHGEFREDLFYRLNVVPLTLPPLRERGEDIPKLIQHFLQLFAHRYHQSPAKLSPTCLRKMLDYTWPGNVRQLSNALERFTLLQDEDELIAAMQTQTATNNRESFVIPEQGMHWESFEQQCLQQALARCNNNRTQAAKLLGMSYKAFIYRINKADESPA